MRAISTSSSVPAYEPSRPINAAATPNAPSRVGVHHGAHRRLPAVGAHIPALGNSQIVAPPVNDPMLTDTPRAIASESQGAADPRPRLFRPLARVGSQQGRPERIANTPTTGAGVRPRHNFGGDSLEHLRYERPSLRNGTISGSGCR
jgi:hypothetical protein